MKRLIYLFILFSFWGCLNEETLPTTTSFVPSGQPALSACAQLFNQRLEHRMQTYTGELNQYADPRTPLTEHVRFGSSPVYGGHYFIVPLQKESSGEIDAALVYPIKSSDPLGGIHLSGELDTPQLLDEAALNSVPDSCRFLLSNKFLHWKKKGLSVSSSLYGYAESLDGKSIFTPSPNRASVNNSMRSVGDYPYEATVYLDYEIEPYCYTNENGAIVIQMPSIEAQEEVFFNAVFYMVLADGLGDFELVSFEYEHLVLRMEMDDDLRLQQLIDDYMWFATNSFYEGYFIENVSYFYSYNLYRNSYMVEEGTGEGAGNASGGSHGGGGNPSPNPSTAQLIAPPSGTLSKAIFNIESRLTANQWSVLENALTRINSDCLGGRLIGAVRGKEILFVYDSTIEAQGLYNHNLNKLTIKSFDSLRIAERRFERTLFHELLHSAQVNNQNAKLNLEIEVHIAMYRYSKKNSIVSSNPLNNCIRMLDLAIDERYQIIDSIEFNRFYNDIIQVLQNHQVYSTYPESSNSRNIHTLQRLGIDCQTLEY